MNLPPSSVRIFSRISNWKQEKNNYSAKFMYGANIKSGGIEYIEFKEYLINFG
jgi:hypothetical protein